MRKVKDIMSTNIVSVTMEDNIYEIAVKMKEHDIGFVPVVEGKKTARRRDRPRPRAPGLCGKTFRLRVRQGSHDDGHRDRIAGNDGG